MQVFDMLMAAGVPYNDPVLPSLFHVAKLSPKDFDIFQLAINIEAPDGIPYALLADVYKRASHSSRWSNFRNVQNHQKDPVHNGLGHPENALQYCAEGISMLLRNIHQHQREPLSPAPLLLFPS